MAAVKPKKAPNKKVVKKANPNVEKETKRHRFQKGNKHAVGNSGPPPLIDYDVRAEALEKWSLKETSFHLAEFAIEQKVSSVRFHDWKKKSSVFAEALARAKDQLNIKVREKLNNPDKFYDRMLAMRDISNYDTLLKIEERDDLAYVSKLKQKEAEKAVLTLDEIAVRLKANDLSQK